MFANFGQLESLAEYRHAELMREVERQRLVNLAVGPRRPLRGMVAAWLFAAAQWVEGYPNPTIPARAEA